MVKQKSTPKSLSSARDRRKMESKFCQLGSRKCNMGAHMAITQLETIHIPRLLLSALLKKILLKYYKPYYRIQIEALRALQEASEIYLTFFIEDSIRSSLRTKQVVLDNEEYLVLELRGNIPGFSVSRI